MRKFQTDIILDHFKKYKSITSLEAIKSYRITRLASVIHILREQYEIVSLQEKKLGKKWVRYVLLGKKK
jgi:hypothetical protein